jgi:hypothetical protein
MPVDPQISITTPVTELLGINQPILLARWIAWPMRVSLPQRTLPADLAF